MATYKRLTLAQRYLIESLHQQPKTQQCMAQQIGVSQLPSAVNWPKTTSSLNNPIMLNRLNNGRGWPTN
ncbi:helix-turn-helix domain-containing protein, partial [Spirosoma arcticum]